MTSSSPGRASAQPNAPRCPLSRGRKRVHPDDDNADVGVDAVLSADMDDAPMRQRQYTALEKCPTPQQTQKFASHAHSGKKLSSYSRGWCQILRHSPG